MSNFNIIDDVLEGISEPRTQVPISTPDLQALIAEAVEDRMKQYKDKLKKKFKMKQKKNEQKLQKKMDEIYYFRLSEAKKKSEKKKKKSKKKEKTKHRLSEIGWSAANIIVQKGTHALVDNIFSKERK